MLEGVPFRGRECVCGRICAYYVADSSVTRFASATSSTLEEEIKRKDERAKRYYRAKPIRGR